MGLKERLIQFIEFKGIEISKFERTVGLSNGFVGKSGNNTRYSSIDKISKIYPELNITWLRTGEGNMLKTTNIASEPEVKYGEPQSIDLTKSSIDRLIETVDRLSRNEETNSNNVTMMNENIKELIAQGKQQTQNITKLVDYLCKNGAGKAADSLEYQKGASHTTVEGKAELTDEKVTGK